MSQDVLEIIAFAIGIGIIALNRKIVMLLIWMDGKISNSCFNRRFSGYSAHAREYKPWMIVLLGVSWVICTIIYWL
jgi:hypothetical protein